ncbi:hypothetical protein E2C01_050114 [Portunus trituberculatus]|uniref:Uncharacterized protein n=1 Tax=Portunus trituberculatus TaxID=210409 RepID=A0A5B7G848_PORTR|nr:hypothetical protein [Portunus trituberculatus]
MPPRTLPRRWSRVTCLLPLFLALPQSFLGLGGVSVYAAHLPSLALGASGTCGEPASAGPVSTLGLVGGRETALHAAPLPGGLPGDGNFVGSACRSPMGLPHVDWLHGSMPSGPAQPVDAGVNPGGAVVSQAAATGWPSFSEEVDQVFDDVPSGEAGTLDEEGAASFRELITSVRESLGLPMPSSLASTLQTGVECTSGTSRPDPTPLVLPRSPLALEVHRKQLGCSLGISNPASAKFTLPRRWASKAERWYTPEGDSCGAPLNDELLHLVESKDLTTLAAVKQKELESLQRSLISQIARGLASTAQGVRAKAGRAIGSQRLVPVAPPSVPPPPAPKVNWAKFDLSPSQRKQFLGMVLDTVRARLSVARLGQRISGSGSTVSASQGSTSVPLEVFAGTSCIPSMVSARRAPADAGSAVVPKEALAGCF